jgi:hypothetical protein
MRTGPMMERTERIAVQPLEGDFALPETINPFRKNRTATSP